MKHLYLFPIALLLLVLGIAMAQPPQRVPAYRGVITHVQPNGDTLHLYLRGDEWYHFSMTLDGWEIYEDQRGKICYMRIKCNGDTVRTIRQAHDADRRTRCEQRWLDKHGVKRIVDRHPNED